MYKLVGHSEVISLKQKKKTEMKLEINMLSKKPLESILPDAGTTYANVCNVIEYSSNKYFASCWYVL
jgi:hypothetical protein